MVYICGAKINKFCLIDKLLVLSFSNTITYVKKSSALRELMLHDGWAQTEGKNLFHFCYWLRRIFYL